MKFRLSPLSSLLVALIAPAGCGSSPAIPATPTGGTASAEDGFLVLSWEAAEWASGYQVFWAEGSDPLGGDPLVIETSRTFVVHGGLTNGSTYHYRIRAVNNLGMSEPSEEFTGTPVSGIATADPLLGAQWHLDNTGQEGGTPGEDINIDGAWTAGFDGEGLRVAIIDNGIDGLHEDLLANMATGESWNYVEGTTDPMGVEEDNPGWHGTAVAGIIGARGGNGLGVTGIAPKASMAGFAMLEAPTNTNMLDAMTRDIERIHVSNNSWGFTPGNGRLGFAPPGWRDAIDLGLSEGRGGLGTIYVFAAGNGGASGDDANQSGMLNHPGIMPVAAVGDDGVQASYSEPGANVWISGPSEGRGNHGITTTDVTGEGGKNDAGPGDLPDVDYTETFDGTSAATPMVAGAVTLMLDANPALGWRDVRAILAETARRNDDSDAGWTRNGAGYWINHKYGFGVVDTSAAVSAAQGWTNLPVQVSFESAVKTVATVIPDDDATGIESTIDVAASGIDFIEYVEVVFDSDHTHAGDLRVVLTSPEGTQSTLAAPHNCGFCGIFDEWTFGVARSYGEGADGTWTLKVSDEAAEDTGEFTSWQLRIYGHEVTP